VHKLTHFLADQAKRELDDRDLKSRSDLRKERKQSEQTYADLARALCECTKRQFDRLTLGDALYQVVQQARQIDSPAAKDRALRLVRRELRNGDSESVRSQLDALDQPPPRVEGEPERWLTRLVAEGDSALSAFLVEYPQSDRNRLRQLLVRARKASGAAAAKSSAALLRCIAVSLEATSATEPDRG
jgi:ribosome-associated protein